MIRKRRKNILWHILLPIVLILVLIPPACSLVFWHFADQFAHYAAVSELGKIQEPLTALIGKTFSAEPEEIGAEDRREQIRGFLLRAQTIIEESGANAEIIVYESSVKQYSGLPVPSSDLAYGKGNYGASGAALPSG